MTRAALLTVGAIVLGSFFFYEGAYYTATGGILPTFTTGVPAAASSASYDSITGKISSFADSSLTLILPDGTTQMIPVDTRTQVVTISAPVPAGLGSLAPGASVMVASPAGGAAQIIQIFPQTTVAQQ